MIVLSHSGLTGRQKKKKGHRNGKQGETEKPVRGRALSGQTEGVNGANIPFKWVFKMKPCKRGQ